MPRCRDVAELVTAYIERALPPRRWLAVRLHLAMCGPCQRYVAQMRAAIRFLGHMPALPPPAPEREEEIMASLPPASPGSSRGSFPDS